MTVERLEERCLLTSYAITDLGTLGGTISNATAINNQGLVVGGSELECNCMDHAFLWAGDALHDLGSLLGSNANSASAINVLGQVVGYRNGDPFLWSRQSGWTDLGFAGFAGSINDRTEIVGSLASPTHAFLWRDGTVLDLGTLSGNVSTAAGLNDQG